MATLTGDWDEVLVLAGQFREGWERAGRPRAGNLTRSAYAAATVYGLRGDDDARAAWLEIVDALATPGRPLSSMHFNEFFDALLLLHRGQGEAAMRLLLAPPEDFRTWASGMWRPWYAALWAEAAVVTGHPDAADRIRRARLATWDNPVAAAIVERAAALAGEPGRAAPDSTGPGGRGPVGRRVPLSVGPDARDHRRGRTGPGRSRAGRDGRDRHGLASRMRLNGVWVARRTRLKPASVSSAASRRSPACAPSPRPTSWSSDPGVQITVDRP